MGGGIIGWLMVMPNGLLSHKIIDGKFCSKDYFPYFQMSIVPILKLNYGENNFFQKDNCTVHYHKHFRNFMSEGKLRSLEWPDNTPYLDIVGGMWKQLSNDICGRSQFKIFGELADRVIEIDFPFFNEKT